MPEVAEPPTQQATPPANHPGSVVVDLSNLTKKAVPKAEVVVQPPVQEEKPAGEVKPPEVTPPVEQPKKPSDKEENMANLRKAREAAEEARKALEEENNRLKTEFEAFKTKAPELPEDVKGKLTKAEQLEKELEESQKLIRQIDLSRDPKFQAKYNKPIMDNISLMGQAAIAAGVSEADWKRVSGEWDRKQLAEWSESMEPLQRIEFTNAWKDAEKLWREQQQELSNADRAWQERQKQQQAEAEAQQKQYFTQNEQLARSILAETIKPETLKEYEDLGPAAEGMLLKAARHELPAKDIFQQLAANQVLARVVPKQAERIKELEAALAERDKKIKEQDEFISNQAGSVPRGDAAGSVTPTNGKAPPVWSNIVVKTPG